MGYSSSLSDKEWEIIEPLLPRKKKTCPPKWTKRQILDGILYQLKQGCNTKTQSKDDRWLLKNARKPKPIFRV